MGNKGNTLSLTLAVECKGFPSEEEAKTEAERQAMEDVYMSELAHAISIRPAGDYWEVEVLVDRKDVR